MEKKDIDIFQDEKEEEKEIFIDYSNSEPPKNMVSKKTAIVSIVATVLVLMIIAASFVGGFFFAKSRGIESDMPLLEQAYELVKKYDYKDISFEEFQLIATQVMVNSIDNYTFMVPNNTTPGSIKAGFGTRQTAYNEHIVVDIEKNSPADVTVAKTYCTNPSYSRSPDSVFEYVEYSQVNVEESKIHLKLGDKLYAVGYAGAKPIVVDGLPVATINKIMAESTDIINLYFYQSNGDGEYLDEGLYKFVIEKKYIINEYATLYTPEQIGDTTGESAMIKFVGFNGSAIPDFAKCAKAFKEAGYKHLILDLRNNGGGDGDILAFIGACLIKGADKESKPMIYNVRNTGNGKMKGEYLSTISSADVVIDDVVTTINALNLPAEIGEDFKLTILCNGHSASSSEALIGALMYYNQTEIIGSKTYGKGVGQITIPFANGKYMLYITNSQYYIPTDENGDGVPEWTKSIHQVGFTPKEENLIDEVIRPISSDKAIQRALTLLNN